VNGSSLSKFNIVAYYDFGFAGTSPDLWIAFAKLGELQAHLAEVD
jgi:hypothetical protein